MCIYIYIYILEPKGALCAPLGSSWGLRPQTHLTPYIWLWRGWHKQLLSILMPTCIKQQRFWITICCQVPNGNGITNMYHYSCDFILPRVHPKEYLETLISKRCELCRWQCHLHNITLWLAQAKLLCIIFQHVFASWLIIQETAIVATLCPRHLGEHRKNSAQTRSIWAMHKIYTLVSDQGAYWTEKSPWDWGRHVQYVQYFSWIPIKRPRMDRKPVKSSHRQMTNC